MFKRSTRLMTAAALFVAALAACDDVPGPTDVTLVPMGESLSADLTDTSLYDNLTLEGASLYTQTTGARLATRTTADPGTVVRTVVGPAGGTIIAGDHSLVIPGNAVLENTEFTMSVLAGTSIIVDLSARSVSSGAEVSWFPVPLTLNLSYKGLAKNADVRLLRNVYLYLDSPDYLVPLVSTLNKSSKTVSSPIWHFSQYGMAME